MKPFDFSPWMSPISGKRLLQESYTWEGAFYPLGGDLTKIVEVELPSPVLIDIKLDIIDLRHAIDNLEQRPYPDLNATYILQKPDANLPNAQALNQLSNGLMKNNGGVIQIAVPGQDYLTPSLPSGQLWIGNSNNIATPQSTITIDNLPNLGTTSITIPNPIDPTNPITISGGKIWQGTDSNRPEESTALLTAEADIALLNARFLLGEFIMGDALVQLTWPKAQFLVNLPDGILKKTGKTLQQAIAGTDYILNLTTNNVFVGDADNLPVAQPTILQQNLPTLANNNLWIGGADNRPAAQPTIAVLNLPNLSNGMVWQGNAANRPVEVQLNFAPADATYIIKTPNANLTNAQVLSELGVGMAKIVAGGAFAIAIAGEDYATAEQLQEIEQQCQQYAEQAQASAEEAAASAGEAATSAGEATAAAGEATGAAAAASGSATAAGLSAAGAVASAIAASASAGSASSSASDASSSASDASHSASNAGQSATNAANSATQAQTYLHTLLNTGLTLQGDVNGNGLLSAPIVTTFKPNPAFTGNQSMTIPVGNGSQRPITLTAGMVRLNTGN